MEHFPSPDSNRNSKDSDTHSEIPHKIPEYIVIEDDRQDPFAAFNPNIPHEMPKIPLKIRFLCLVIGLVAAMWTIGALVVCLVTIACALITFGQVKTLNRLIKTYWDAAKKGWVVTLGLTIAIVSPLLGFALIVSYFTLIGQSSSRSGIQSILQSSFRDYMFK